MSEPLRLQTNTQRLAEAQGHQLAQLRTELRNREAEVAVLLGDVSHLEAENRTIRQDRHRLQLEVRGWRITMERQQEQIERLLALGISWFAAAGIAAGMLMWWLAP